jgi:hypothetical protein
MDSGRRSSRLVVAGGAWLAVLSHALCPVTDNRPRPWVHKLVAARRTGPALAAPSITELIRPLATSTVAGDVARRSGLRPAEALLVPARMVASGIGIHRGRMLCWNSWDLLTPPGLRFHEAARKLSASGAAMHPIAVTGIATSLCWAG